MHTDRGLARGRAFVGVVALAVPLAGCELIFPNEVVGDAPTSSIAWVQTGYGPSSATFSNAQTAGNLNVIVMGWGDATQTIVDVSDTLGNAYSVAAPTLATDGMISPALSQAIYFA